MTPKVAQKVDAWVCPRCQTLHRSSEEARACCACRKCRTPFLDGPSHGRCGACLYGARLREARRQVKDYAERLETAKEQLTQLLKDGKPTKGSAP